MEDLLRQYAGKRCYLISKEPGEAFYGSLGHKEARSFQAMFMSDIAENADELFNDIDALPLTCCFTVTRLEDNREVDSARYQRARGQIRPLQEPTNSPLTHLMREIAHFFNTEDPHSALRRRWSRSASTYQSQLENLTDETEIALAILSDPIHLAVSTEHGLDAAFWQQEAQDTYKRVLRLRGVILAYEQGIKALSGTAPLQTLQRQRDHAGQQLQHDKDCPCFLAGQANTEGLHAGYSILCREMEECISQRAPA